MLSQLSTQSCREVEHKLADPLTLQLPDLRLTCGGVKLGLLRSSMKAVETHSTYPIGKAHHLGNPQCRRLSVADDLASLLCIREIRLD